MKKLSLEEVILFHEKLIVKTGGKHGIRNESLIDSAINRGLSSFDGVDLYKTDIEKIAAITHSLVCNHGFIDGNKRIGIAVMVLLLKLNNLLIEYTQDELIDLGLSLADGNYKYEDVLSWISNHITS